MLSCSLGGEVSPFNKVQTMHLTLLIDEILRLIFEAVLNDDRPSLCSVARCCRAWKEPALDLIWRRLPTAIPLLSLLPGFSMVNDTVRLNQPAPNMSFAAFEFYSTRVKHLVHHHPVVADPSISADLFHRLNSLESVRIESRAFGKVALHMSLASRLRVLMLRIGYLKSSSISTAVHSMSLLQGCPSLEQLSVRGHFPECLHVPLSSMRTLRSLSLRLSSLTERSFMTVSALPLLADFDVHADNLSYDVLSAAIARSRNKPFFPSLEKLKIRTRPFLAALIVQQLPRHKLRSLYVDVAGPTRSSAFEDVFKAMADLSVQEFALEYAVCTEEMPISLAHLQPLSKLPLRRLILDSSLPPDLSDADIEEMVNWWPSLDRLELGSRIALENVETTWNPKISLASLATLARRCKCLESLVVTLDVDLAHSLADSSLIPLATHPLTSLSISSLSRPDVPAFSTFLARLFPSLSDVTPGFVGEHGDVWVAVQATFSIPSQ